ncbi:MAG: ABC transporter permease subunit [Chitinivibrionales bacterium]|nr:ABC transporter permease subunit [Chitinivibrionales bacterium]
MFLVFSLLGGVVLLFIIAPLAAMFLQVSPGVFAETAADKEVRGSIMLTLWTSMAATAVFAIAAVPLAYLLARAQFPLKRFVNGTIDLPIVIPHSAAGIALLGVFSRDTIAGKAFGALGIEFVGGYAGIMAAMAFVSLPFLINASRDGFAAVPQRYENVARNLGASPIRTFFTISVPLASRSIVSGLVLMFARGMSEFGAVIIIAYHPMITPVLIFERFGAFGLKYARPVSVVFISVCLVFFIVLRSISGEKRKFFQ